MSVRTTFLPYSAPFIGEEEIDAVINAMRSGFLSGGPNSHLFEKQFSEYVGAKHAIAVSSCTCALQLALAAYDIGPGDEVIVPTITFAATANVVEHLGARAVFADVDENLQICPSAVARALTIRTKAIVPVHYGGQSCALDELLTFAEQNGLQVVQDAAHATGTEYKGYKIGGYGGVTAFSFYPSKNMTTGEGGMLTLNDDGLATRIRELALHGIRRSAGLNRRNTLWNYEVVAPGYKGNMPDLLAVIGIEQLKKLNRFIERRREIAARYSEAFCGLRSLSVPSDIPGRPHAYHLYTLRVTTPGFDRDSMLSHLEECKIGSSVHFTPLHHHPYYAGRESEPEVSYSNTERVFPQIFSLPIYPAMSNSDVDTVIAAVVSSLPKCLPKQSGAAA